MNEPTDEQLWERKTLKELLLAGLKEQQRARRWKVFFRLLWWAVIIAILYSLLMRDEVAKPRTGLRLAEHTAVIDVVGLIAYGERASADNVIGSLEAAFGNSAAKAVVLRINSRGGSPVQSRQIYHAIKRLRQRHADKKLYAVIEDVGTSGAYLVAAAADEIYADKTSIVGSIGVVMGSFGFVGAMEKLGIERRLYAAGEHKAMLDPFSPRSAEEEQFLQAQLDDIHQEFIANVQAGRGSRLQLTNADEIFSGRFWVASEVMDYGLIDGYSDVYTIARDVIAAPKLVNYTKSGSLVEEMLKKVGEVTAESFLNYKL